MELTEWKRILKNRKMQFSLLCFVVIGIMPVMFKGLSYGIDFTGGTLIKVKLSEAVETSTMEVVTANVDERLNGLGLKDIRVRPWGNEFIMVEVAATDYATIAQMESILRKEGKFEAVIEGVLAIGSNDVYSVKTSPQDGYAVRRLQQGAEWFVPFVLKSEGALRFSAAAKGKCVGGVCSRVFMFIDRPEEAIVLIPFRVWSQIDGDGEELMYMDPETRTTLIDISEVERDSLSKFILMKGNEITSEEIGILSNLTSERKLVIVPDWFNDTAQIASLGYSVKNLSKGTKAYWIWSAIGLKSIAYLNAELTDGSPHSELLIRGGSASYDEGQRELKETAILLSAGKLPVSASVESSQTISPLLGSEFFTYSFIAGIISMVLVASLIYLRYKHASLVLPIMYTSISEIVMTLGIAAIISWNLDLAGVAGIIAAVGTGVNDQIIMTDEVLLGGSSESEKQYGFMSRLKRAFKTILTAAATIVASMFPLMSLGMGVLRGFAITTIIGVFVGITVTRPAYADVINYLIE
jgi:preprotein translocase subunit SecD